MTEELEHVKTRLIEQYKANGGTKSLDNFSVAMILNELDHLREMKTLQDQLSALKRNAVIQPVDPKGNIQPVDMGRENAVLAREAAIAIRGYYDYVEPPWDPRSILDESLKRDNELLKAADDDPRSVVILRDSEGRCI
jgi:hypothetical protein